MNLHRSLPTGARSGYVLLLSILFIGVICATIFSSMLLLGINALQVTHSLEQSGQALSLAQGCADYALLQLRTTQDYLGNEVMTYDTGTCEVLAIGGTGNTNRLLCTEGQAGDSVRRLEIVVQQILPQTTIGTWQEVANFSLCQ